MSNDEKKTKLIRQMEEGGRADTTLQHLESAFAQLREDVFNKFAESDPHDHMGHMTCRIYMKVAKDVEDRFKLAVRKGKAASKELIKINEPKVREINDG